MHAYRTAHDTIISVSQFYPVPAPEEFVITPRQAEARAVVEKHQRQKDASTTTRLVAAGVLDDDTVLRLRPEGVNEEYRSQLARWVEEDPRRASARWHNVAGTPLVWEADGKPYSLSGLAELAMQQATGVARSLRGGDWWITEDGRDLVELAQELAPPRQRAYLEFWSRFAERLRDNPRLEAIGQPSENNWFEIRSSLPTSFFSAAFLRGGGVKFELYIDTGIATKNDQMLKQLMGSKTAIEDRFGATLTWNPSSAQHRCAACPSLHGWRHRGRGAARSAD